MNVLSRLNCVLDVLCEVPKLRHFDQKGLLFKKNKLNISQNNSRLIANLQLSDTYKLEPCMLCMEIVFASFSHVLQLYI